MITKWNHPLDPLWPPRNPKTELFNLNLKKGPKRNESGRKDNDLIFMYSEIENFYSEKVKNIYRKYSKINGVLTKLILRAILFSRLIFHNTRKSVGF